MTKEQILAQANAQGQVLTGAAALQQMTSVLRRDISESILQKGDTIHFPKKLDDTNLIMSYIGSNIEGVNRRMVPRVICEVTSENGEKSHKEVFAGSFTKAARHETTGKTVKTLGTAVDLLNAAIYEKDVFEAFLGKNIKVTNVTEVPTRAYNLRTQAMAPRNTNIYQFDLV